MDSNTRAESDVYDVIGIGFGPSNLALAIAIEEHNETADQPLRSVFLEKQPKFGWHRGMLLDGATMQVSFLKDLVTLRNPSSDFSFLHYLQDKGRLIDFINHKTLFPLRLEFHDYFEWAAGRLEHTVHYGAEAMSVEPITGPDGEIEFFDVISREGSDPDQLVIRRTRNLVVATGLSASLPEGTKLSDRVFHNLELVPRVKSLQKEHPKRFVVVGAGQSGGETVEYLHRMFPEAEVCVVMARYGYTPADDSPFANRMFDPEAVDLYFNAPKAVKRSLFDYHRNTNYSVVDLDLIEELYRRSYQEKVLGKERLRWFNCSRITSVRESAEKVSVDIEYLPTGESQTLDADHIVYATGYGPSNVLSLLGEAGQLCQRDDEGLLQIERDYRLRTGTKASIYLQGGTEYAHGITSTLLSNTAIRTGEIVRSILGERPAPANPSALGQPVESGTQARHWL